MISAATMRDGRVAEMIAELHRRVVASAEGRIVRVERALPDDTDPLLWLGAQKGAGISRAGYWRERDSHEEIAAIGVSDVVRAPSYDRMEEAVDEVSHRLTNADEGVRYFGGLRFEAERGGDAIWDGWGGCEFGLPACGVERTQRGVVFFVQARSDGGRSLSAASLFASEVSLDFSGVRSSRTAKECARDDLPDFARWEALVKEALGQISAGALNKVVLARRTRIAWDNVRDPFVVLGTLRRMEPHCTIYAALGSEAAFLGASPELLYHRRDRELETEALAGTLAVPDAQAHAGDTSLSRHSEKNIAEQGVVAQWLKRRLEPFCELVNEEALRTRQLHSLNHLLTTIRTRLKSNVSDAQLLRLLHPTPAVAGQPRDAALGFIAGHEPFERGWYAAPVGWLSASEARFIVALRCAMLRGHEAWLYTGAGIVFGSTPSSEWDEVENKTVTLCAAIGGEG